MDFICCTLDRSSNALCSSETCCIVSTLKSLWGKGGYSTLADTSIRRKVLTLYKDYKKLKPKSKTDKFLDKTKMLFDIGHSDLEGLIKSDKLRSEKVKDIDLLFLADQRGDRKLYMQTEDKIYKKRAEQRRVRLDKQVRLRGKEEERRSKKVVLDDDCQTIDLGDDDDDSFTPKMKHRRPDLVTLTLPTKTLGALTEKVAKTNKISIRAQTSMISRLINVGKGNLDDFNLSVGTVCAQANQVMRTKAKSIREDKKLMIKDVVGILHFDGRIVKEYTEGIVESKERIAVLFTSPLLEREVLLGIPKMSDSCGLTQIQGLIPILEDWNLKEKIIGVACDSTSAQTGRFKGAIILLQNYLAAPFFWIICRHHIMETHVKHVTEEVLGKTSAPFEPLFKDLQSRWNSINIDYSILQTFEHKEFRGTTIEDQVYITKQFCQMALSTDTFQRGDYRELVELTLVFLGGNIPAFKFKRPGAFHHARFMAKGIYIMKMALLIRQLTYLSDEVVKKVKRLSIFISLYFVRWFLQSSVAVKATTNDLATIKEMHLLAEFDSGIARVVLKSVSRHTWYITPRFAIFSIVDEDLEDSVRMTMASKLLSTEIPEEFQVGYPELVDLETKPNLTDLIGPESWYVFKVSGTEADCTWLTESCVDWPKHENYRKLKVFVEGFNVTNDTAERGVKLIQEFVDSCRNEELRQDLLLTVQEHRSKFNSSNLSKE